MERSMLIISIMNYQAINHHLLTGKKYFLVRRIFVTVPGNIASNKEGRVCLSQTGKEEIYCDGGDSSICETGIDCCSFGLVSSGTGD
jgi:hypothetical protein